MLAPSPKVDPPMRAPRPSVCVGGVITFAGDGADTRVNGCCSMREAGSGVVVAAGVAGAAARGAGAAAARETGAGDAAARDAEAAAGAGRVDDATAPPCEIDPALIRT